MTRQEDLAARAAVGAQALTSASASSRRSSRFACICPPKSLELGADGKLHRHYPQEAVHAELEALNLAQDSPQGRVSFAHLPGGGVACFPSEDGDGDATQNFVAAQCSIAVEGETMAVISGSLENYAYLVKKFCADDDDCREAARRGLNDIKAAAPISPALLLCRLFRKIGKDMLAKLRGQFAFVVYDAAMVRVLAARDPSGAIDLVHGRCASGALVVASGVTFGPGADVTRIRPGFFKYGWYSKPHKFATDLNVVQREANEATSAVLKALAGIAPRSVNARGSAFPAGRRAAAPKPESAPPLTRQHNPKVVPPLLETKSVAALLGASEFVPGGSPSPISAPATPPAAKSQPKEEAPKEEPPTPFTPEPQAPTPPSPLPPLLSNFSAVGVPQNVLEVLAGVLGRESQQSRLLGSMLETSPCAMVITDAQAPDNPIVYANPVFELRTGYSQSEVLGRNCRFLQAPPSQARSPSFASMSLKRNVLAGASCSVRILNYRKDGTEMWNDLSIVPLRNAEGDVTHFIGLQSFREVGMQPQPVPRDVAACLSPRSPKHGPERLKASFIRSNSCNTLNQLGPMASKSQSYGNLASLAAPGITC